MGGVLGSPTSFLVDTWQAKDKKIPTEVADAANVRLGFFITLALIGRIGKWDYLHHFPHAICDAFSIYLGYLRRSEVGGYDGKILFSSAFYGKYRSSDTSTWLIMRMIKWQRRLEQESIIHARNCMRYRM